MVLFHTALRRKLAEDFREGRAPQSFCFWGPQGIGKHTLALGLAQIFSCEKPVEGKGCDECRNCRALHYLKAPDLMVIGSGDAIGIEEVRTVRDHLTRSPLSLPFSLAILANMDTASVQAQQAFLKTLEEPRPHSMIILTAAVFSNLLLTIQSRVASYRLAPVTLSDIAEALRTQHCDASAIDVYVRFSLGIPGRIWRQGNLRDDLDEEIDLLRKIKDSMRTPYWKVRNAVDAYFQFQKEHTAHCALERLLQGLFALDDARCSFDGQLMRKIFRNAQHFGNRELIIDAITMGICYTSQRIGVNRQQLMHA